MHVVMRSTRATGQHSMLRQSREVADILNTQAQRHHVKIHSVANAGNHIHLLLQAPSRAQLSAFLRAISGRIAQLMLNNGTGLPGKMIPPPSVRLKSECRENFQAEPQRTQGFWDARPFSRIVNSGRDLQNVARYLTLNSTESSGMTRQNVRTMFNEIQSLLRQGILPRTPELFAAGFG